MWGVSALFRDLRDGPCCGLGEDRIFSSNCGPGFQLRKEFFVAGVAHGDGHVAMKTFAARALDGRTLKPTLEGGGVHAGEPIEGGVDELRVREHAFGLVSLCDGWLRRGFADDGSLIRLIIPWADVLTDVAAEDLAADGSAQIFGDCTFLFDGEVGNAARCVHLAWSNEGVSRAGVDAAGAGAAAIRRGSKCGGGGDRDRRDDDAKEEPGTKLLVDDASVLADP